MSTLTDNLSPAAQAELDKLEAPRLRRKPARSTGHPGGFNFYSSSDIPADEQAAVTRLARNRHAEDVLPILGIGGQ